MKPFATIISQIFEPMYMLIVFAVIAVLHTGAHVTEALWFFGILGLGFFLPISVIRVWAVKTKRISNWDISNRKERVPALVVAGLFLLGTYFSIRAVGNTELSRIFLLFLIAFLGYLLVTLFWKMSGHLTYTMIPLALCIHWYGGYTWAFLAVAPILSWSRVVLRRHTVAQTIAGTLYGCAVVILGIYFRIIS